MLKVFVSDIFSIVSEARNAQVTFAKKYQKYNLKKKRYIVHT